MNGPPCTNCGKPCHYRSRATAKRHCCGDPVCVRVVQTLNRRDRAENKPKTSECPGCKVPQTHSRYCSNLCARLGRLYRKQDQLPLSGDKQ